MDPTDDLIPVKQAVKFMAVRPSAVRRYIRLGKLVAQHQDGILVLKRSDERLQARIIRKREPWILTATCLRLATAGSALGGVFPDCTFTGDLGMEIPQDVEASRYRMLPDVRLLRSPRHPASLSGVRAGRRWAGRRRAVGFGGETRGPDPLPYGGGTARSEI
jgi:hypothetical protein